MLKNLIKKLIGADKIKEQAANEAAESLKIAKEAMAAAKEAEQMKIEAEAAAKEAMAQEESAKMTQKERATRRKEPWVGVLNTHVNENNVKNGFFELDWNEYFIVKLKEDGYGFDGDPDEEIVDRWFRELCANVVVDGDYGGPIEAGSVVNKLKE